jgi:protein-L-isoaspartate O-methyltransferase
MKPLLLTGAAFLTLATVGSDAGEVLPIAVDGTSNDEILAASGISGLNAALCSIRITRTAIKQVRRKLASIGVLRSAWHLALALRNELRWRPVTQSSYAKCFAAHPDPWGYEVTPFTLEKFQATMELLDEARGDACFKQAWEIGCAEGVMTARLARICERLAAVDFIPLALERARERCRTFDNVSFTKWDLKSDPTPGEFDLIVITDVLGSLGRKRDICRAREKLVGALTSGGFLLYGDYIGDVYSRRIHDSWWGRLLLLRPRKILRLIAADPALVEVARRETARHLFVLFRRQTYGPRRIRRADRSHLREQSERAQ